MLHLLRVLASFRPSPDLLMTTWDVPKIENVFTMVQPSPLPGQSCLQHITPYSLFLELQFQMFQDCLVDLIQIRLS